jgi:hypothetical protein
MQHGRKHDVPRINRSQNKYISWTRHRTLNRTQSRYIVHTCRQPRGRPTAPELSTCTIHVRFRVQLAAKEIYCNLIWDQNFLEMCLQMVVMGV